MNFVFKISLSTSLITEEAPGPIRPKTERVGGHAQIEPYGPRVRTPITAGTVHPSAASPIAKWLMRKRRMDGRVLRQAWASPAVRFRRSGVSPLPAGASVLLRVRTRDVGTGAP